MKQSSLYQDYSYVDRGAIAMRPKLRVHEGQKARKCQRCGKQIFQGDRYWTQQLKKDGEYDEVTRQCMDCSQDLEN